MQINTTTKMTQTVASQLSERAQAQAGRRKNRILSQSDVTRFINLFRKHRHTATRIRVYSGDGFVANGYKYRADIDCIDAKRGQDGIWHVSVQSVDAKRTYGRAALATVDGKGVE